LNRDVAIKVSAERFSERFEREAHAIAALNHPNICTLYDVGPDYLVMELVEGEEPKGPMAAEDAIAIMRQVADALEAAHDHGIIHRDLKPGNIKVKPDGTVKVLDFGLAKLGPGHSTGALLNQDSPTIKMDTTHPGVILGTPAYMSPEQARGKYVDRRTDIWAFGVVFYELLTGVRLFNGEDLAETLASIVKEKPDLSVVPPNLRRLLQRCLEKNPRSRLRDISSVALLLEEPAPAVVPEAARTAHLTMELPAGMMLGPADLFSRPAGTAFAISPDGATVVFAAIATDQAKGARTTMLYRRPLASTEAAVMPGTEAAANPFFSPDGQWVAFVTASKMKKVALRGGPPIDLCDVSHNRIRGHWGNSGIIAFTDDGLNTVPEGGGTPAELITNRNSDQMEDSGSQATPTGAESLQYGGFHSAHVLPDGRTVLFTQLKGPNWDKAHVDAVDLKTKKRKPLLTNAADARYLDSGHLVFVRNTSLLAVPFDLGRLEVTGPPVPLVADVMQAQNAPNGLETGSGQYAIASDGTLIYAQGGIYATCSTSIVIADNAGNEAKLASISGLAVFLRVSPDGRRLAAIRGWDRSSASDIWFYDIPSGARTRATSDGEFRVPLWSLDGAFLLVSHVTKGLVRQAANSDGEVDVLISPARERGVYPCSISPDGKWFMYGRQAGNVRQLFVRPVGKDFYLGDAKPFAPSLFETREGVFSPDGKWVAYTSTESGEDRIYVQPFPGPGEKRLVSDTEEGTNPVWSSDGRCIFFLRPHPGSVDIMEVEVSVSGPALSVGIPRKLFSGRYSISSPTRTYDVTADGRFTLLRWEGENPDERVTKLHVLLGWGEELKRRVPAMPRK
jgi:serine/threonine-protein kinase